MRRLRFRLGFLNGLKQKPKDYDFCITPVLKFGRMPKEEEYHALANGYAIGLEWGHWAIVLYIYWLKQEYFNIKLNN